MYLFLEPAQGCRALPNLHAPVGKGGQPTVGPEAEEIGQDWGLGETDFEMEIISSRPRLESQTSLYHRERQFSRLLSLRFPSVKTW